MNNKTKAIPPKELYESLTKAYKTPTGGKTNYKMERPNQKTFKVLLFNGQMFAIGRGLFIHLMKYFQKEVEELKATSRSKLEFTLENFVNVVRGQKSHFKGMKLTYVDVDKSYREEIKFWSSLGEGWWPERKVLRKPEIDYDLSFVNFLMNREDFEFHRCLGKGINVPNTDRWKYQVAVEFTREGLRRAIMDYRKLVDKPQLFALELPPDNFTWYQMKALSAMSPIPTFEPVYWTIYTIRYKKDREEFLNANREIFDDFTRDNFS